MSLVLQDLGNGSSRVWVGHGRKYRVTFNIQGTAGTCSCQQVTGFQVVLFENETSYKYRKFDKKDKVDQEFFKLAKDWINFRTKHYGWNKRFEAMITTRETVAESLLKESGFIHLGSYMGSHHLRVHIWSKAVSFSRRNEPKTRNSS